VIAELPVLQEIVRRESRSLLQYIHDSFPWTPNGERAELSRIRQFAEEQRKGAAELSRWLAKRRHNVPYLGSYPSGFTTINYVALHYVVPKLIADEKQGLAQLEQDLASVTDPEARAIVEKIAVSKRAHLQALEAFAAHSEPVVNNRAF
jgi:rubrerythrin